MSKKYDNSNKKDDYEVTNNKKGNRKPKRNYNRKPNNNSQSNRDTEVTDKRDKYVNDASNYISDPELRKQAGNYPFNTFLGVPDTFNIDAGSTPTASAIPSVISIRVNPALGKTNLFVGPGINTTTSAAVNAVARMWYNTISAETGRTANYSPDDIAIIIGAMSELVSTIAQAFRIYGLAFNFSMRNRSIPKSLIGATGCDPDTILPKMAEFRMRLNTLLIQANSLPIPADVEIFKRNWNIFSRAFVDETSSLAQMFLFTEYSTWILDERTTPGSTGSSLRTYTLDNQLQVSNPTSDYVFSAFDLLDLIEAQILALQTASTYNMVYADIMSVLNKKGGKFYQFGYLPELYVVAPEFSEEAITQMHNLIIMGIPSTTVPTGAPSYATPANDVVADVTIASVHHNPNLPFYRGFSTEVLMDIPFSDHPTEDDIVNFSRFMGAWDKPSSVSTGSYECDGYTITDKYVVAVLYLSDANYKLTDATFKTSIMMQNTAICTPNNIHLLAALRHYPTLYFMDSSTHEFNNYVQELNYFTHLNYFFLQRLNDLCCYGLFKCPFA